MTSFPKSAIGPMAASMELKMLTAEWFRCAVLAHGADQVDEECEHVKETEIMILRLCGIWSTTRPMADLATCCISAQCVASFSFTSDLASITHASLAPGNDQRSLSFLSTLRSEKRTFMENMAVQAKDTLHKWIFDDAVELPPALWDLVTEAVLFLEDAIFALRHGSALVEV